MVPETSLFLKKISPNKYELLTKDLDIEQGSYSIQNIDGLWIMKKLAQTSMFKNSEIHTKGFFIFEDSNSATKFAYSIREDIEQEKVKGIKGFNNRFYFFSTTYYTKMKDKIIPLLTVSPQTLTQLAEGLEVNEDIVKGILELLKEDGLVFEKKKDVFHKI
ncbi:MAG: hypothetical protein PHH82_04325 [Candidatus ainarchaeum sp.]|nr:hypothetical protein [Candidatus ainarchaeum sp.]